MDTPSRIAQRVDRAVSAIDSMIRSPRIERYLVGFTKSPTERRVKSYLGGRNGFDHFAVLLDGLSGHDALSVEEGIWRQVSDSDRRSFVFKKAHDKMKAGTYRRSSGGVPKKSLDEKIYCIYVTWWDIG